jgi:hypothetical protein
MSDNTFPLPLPVVVVTGEYESGKTLAILTTGYPLDKTLIYDNEDSSTLYAQMGDFTRVDLMAELGRDNPGGWTNLQFYEAWVKHMRSIKPGRYDVIGIDPIERVEAGLTDWVRKNPSHFGHTPNQYRKTTGLFWGDVKDLWGKHILEMRAKAQMVVLTAHMRNVYQAGKPVPGKRERKGKDTLSEFATLEITLVRNPGQVRPSAKVDKTRLVYGNLDEPETLRPMFDPWIKEFTWDRVREYMKTGADPDNLVTPPEPTEEEKEMRKLELQAEIAKAETARLEAGIPPTKMPQSRAKCPICQSSSPLDSNNGHAPYCGIDKDGNRVRIEEAQPELIAQ